MVSRDPDGQKLKPAESDLRQHTSNWQIQFLKGYWQNRGYNTERDLTRWGIRVNTSNCE